MPGKRGVSSPETPGVLPSWNLTAVRGAIEGFVETVTRNGGPHFVPPAERIAVFDTDGTCGANSRCRSSSASSSSDWPLWPRRRPPSEAASRGGRRITGIMAGWDEPSPGTIRATTPRPRSSWPACSRAFRGWPVEDYEREADAFLHHARHPTLHRGLAECGYQPMIELLRYLEANEFSCYLAAGGDRDFMRTLAEAIYGIPPERVIGNASALRYREGPEGGAVVFRALPDVFDDGPSKPVRIWSRIGRRPIFVAGNSNADIPMLEYAGNPGRPVLRLLLQHDDRAREFAYGAGAERALELAPRRGWTVVSIRQDWGTVFAEAPALALR
jgi:hypothetical protein